MGHFRKVTCRSITSDALRCRCDFHILSRSQDFLAAAGPRHESSQSSSSTISTSIKTKKKTNKQQKKQKQKIAERKMVPIGSKSLMLTPAKMHTQGDKYVNLRCIHLSHYNVQSQTPDLTLFEHTFL